MKKKMLRSIEDNASSVSDIDDDKTQDPDYIPSENECSESSESEYSESEEEEEVEE